MNNVTKLIITNKYKKLNLGDFFIVTLGEKYLYFGDNILNDDLLVIRIYQGNKGMTIAWNYQNKVVTIPNLSNVDIDTQIEYYIKPSKNIFTNGYNLENKRKGTQYIFRVTNKGWDIQQAESGKINQTKNNDANIEIPICQLNKIYLSTSVKLKNIDENPRKIAKSVWDFIFDRTFEKIEENAIRRKIIEKRIKEEIDGEERKKVIDEKKKRQSEIEKEKSEDVVLEKIKEQTLNLLDLYPNEQLRKMMINMVNHLKPGYIDQESTNTPINSTSTVNTNENINNNNGRKINNISDDNIPDNILTITKKRKNPTFRLDKIYELKKNNQKPQINNTTNKNNSKYYLTKFILNSNGKIMCDSKEIDRNNNGEFIIPIDNGKIWLTGGGSGGSDNFGGICGEAQYLNLNNEIIHVVDIGEGGDINGKGGDTILYLEKSKKIITTKGGKGVCHIFKGEKSNNSSGHQGGNGGNKNTKGENGFIFIKFIKFTGCSQ